MTGLIELTMEVDGMMMDVVAEYAVYGNNVASLETIMDTDGEPLDLNRQERVYLENRIREKHRTREVA